jgi:hypothetical protein
MVLTDFKCQCLVNDFQAFLSKGKLETERIVREQGLQTYWNIDERLAREGLIAQENYGQTILEDSIKTIRSYR